MFGHWAAFALSLYLSLSFSLGRLVLTSGLCFFKPNPLESFFLFSSSLLCAKARPRQVFLPLLPFPRCPPPPFVPNSRSSRSAHECRAGLACTVRGSESPTAFKTLKPAFLYSLQGWRWVKGFLGALTHSLDWLSLKHWMWMCSCGMVWCGPTCQKLSCMRYFEGNCSKSSPWTCKGDDVRRWWLWDWACPGQQILVLNEKRRSTKDIDQSQMKSDGRFHG